jgi:hypothetical protein
MKPKTTEPNIADEREELETQRDQLADALGKLLGASPTASVESLVEAALKRTGK